MSAFLNEYYVTPTVSGESVGSINIVDVSGGTAPWTVSWSGATVNGYITSTQWDLNHLAEGLYKATITDVNGNVGITNVKLSAYTNPTFSADITSSFCVLQIQTNIVKLRFIHQELIIYLDNIQLLLLIIHYIKMVVY